jgi:hypothetical protein
MWKSKSKHLQQEETNLLHCIVIRKYFDLLPKKQKNKKQKTKKTKKERKKERKKG